MTNAPTYERLIERISDAYCAVDTGWRITYWNDQMAALTEMQATDAEGNILWDVVPELRGSTIETACREVMEMKESRSVETRLCKPFEDWAVVTIDADENGLSIHAREATDHKQHEQQLELAETIFENAQDGLFLIDVNERDDEYTLQRVNPAYEKHTGLANSELHGRGLQEVFGDEEGTSLLKNYRECVNQREPLQYEERVSVPDGGSDWETRIAPVVVDDSIEKLVGATRNITERKEREREYDAIFNQTYQFTGLLDPDGTLLKANESALAFGGFDRKDVVGCPVWETGWWQLDGKTQETLKSAVDQAASGEFVRYDEEVQGNDETVIIDFSIRPITDEQGEISLLVAEGRDITDHKRHEQELAQKREFLEQIQEIADVGGWEVDLRSERMHWTEEVYRIHEMPTNYEPTVEDGINFYHPQDRETISDVFQQLVTAGEAYDLELRIVTDRNERRWVRSVGKPWYDDGEIIGARGAFRDITERKEREQKLMRTNERLDEFAAVVSHDLRNPLNVAATNVEMELSNGDSDNLIRAMDALERMGTLIEDVLTLTRQGTTIGDESQIDLATAVDQAWQTVRSESATLGVSAEIGVIRADPGRLGQLLENLLSNAVSHGGDDVVVDVGRLPDESGIYVADNGPGIPETDRTKVFDTGYTTSSDGTGFGLSIVKQIVDAQGWEITVTEESTGGSRFEISGMAFASL